jgi:Carbamoyl-phosphate synthase L chain, ATP binding domain
MSMVCYPGTRAFMRFDYPSRLPEALQEKVKQVACRAMQAVGHNHGFYNIEMTVDQKSGDIKVIEINPRMADQFSRLYAQIDGRNLHDMGLDMALGQTPDLEQKVLPDRVGASFVFRRFHLDHLPSPPDGGFKKWLAEFDPHAILADFSKTGSQLHREMKWLGSYRYAVLNMTAPSREELWRKYETVRNRLGWDVTAEQHQKASWAE